MWSSVIIPYYSSIDNPVTHRISIYYYTKVDNRFVFVLFSNVYGYYNAVSEDLITFYVDLQYSSSAPVSVDDGKYMYRNASVDSVSSFKFLYLKYWLF